MVTRVLIVLQLFGQRGEPFRVAKHMLSLDHLEGHELTVGRHLSVLGQRKRTGLFCGFTHRFWEQFFDSQLGLHFLDVKADFGMHFDNVPLFEKALFTMLGQRHHGDELGQTVPLFESVLSPAPLLLLHDAQPRLLELTFGDDVFFDARRRGYANKLACRHARQAEVHRRLQHELLELLDGLVAPLLFDLRLPEGTLSDPVATAYVHLEDFANFRLRLRLGIETELLRCLPRVHFLIVIKRDTPISSWLLCFRLLSNFLHEERSASFAI